MAIVRIGGTQGGTNNAGAITLTLPGSMNVNDLIIVAFGVGDDDFTQPTLAMTTAGYTELTTSTLSVDGGTAGDGNLAVFYKFHNGSDTTAVCAAAGTGTDSATCAGLQVFRGVATVAQGGPLEIAIQTATGASGGDPNPPQVSGFTEATSAIVIAGMVASATAPLTLTAPTNYTTNAVNGTGTDTFSGSMGLAYRLTGAADPEDPGVFADSGTGAGWCAATLVLKAGQITQAIDTTATLTAALARSVLKPVAVTVTHTADIVRSTLKSVAVGATLTAGIVRSTLKPLAIEVTHTVALAVSKVVMQAINVTVTLTLAISRVILKALDIVVTHTVEAVKQSTKTIAVGVTASAELVTEVVLGTITQAIDVGMRLSVSLVRILGKAVIGPGPPGPTTRRYLRRRRGPRG